MKIHRFFTTVIYIYTFKVSKTYNWIVHGYECLFLALSFFKLREREGYTKFGCEGKMFQSYLSYFFDGVPLENFSSFTG